MTTDVAVLRAAVDAATNVYTGDPIDVTVMSGVLLSDMHGIVEEYRTMGWTISYELEPLRLVVS